MRVLLVTNYKPGRGGISGQVEYLEKYLRQEGYGAEIFSTKGTVLYSLTAFFKLIHISKKFDVIHAHGCSGAGMIPVIYAVTAGRINHKRVVATYHGGGAEAFFAKHSRLVKRYLLKTDANIVLSGFLGNVFGKYGIPYVILPNIVEFGDRLYRRREVINPNFVSIRTLSHLYNIECIIKAFQVVKSRLPGATLTIVGDGPVRQELEAMVNDNHIADVTFTGRVPNQDIYKYLDKADVMLSASKVDNMPVSVLEAFNAGLLVISSNVGGVPYMIEDGRNGLLFESDNHQQLAEKMIWALEHQSEAGKMIENAHQCVGHYSWSSIKMSLLKIYKLI